LTYLFVAEGSESGLEPITPGYEPIPCDSRGFALIVAISAR